MKYKLVMILVHISLVAFDFAVVSFQKNADAEGLRVDMRMEAHQDRGDDRRKNTADGIADRQEFREGRRNSIGEGPEARVENRQNKRENRRDRGNDRMQD